jgi:hypothetical protein
MKWVLLCCCAHAAELPSVLDWATTSALGLRRVPIVEILRETDDPQAFVHKLLDAGAALAGCGEIDAERICAPCYRGVIQELLQDLDHARTTLDTTQASNSLAAKSVCSGAPVAHRDGGASLCCLVSDGTDCAQQTTSPVQPVPAVWSSVELTGGTFAFGGAPSSTMVGDCCSTSSECTNKSWLLEQKLDLTLAELNNLHANQKQIGLNSTGALARDPSASIAAREKAYTRALESVSALCELAPASSRTQFPSTFEELRSQCVGGAVYKFIRRGEGSIARVKANIGALDAAVRTIKKVISVLMLATGDSDPVVAADAQGRATELLRQAMRNTGSTTAVAALKKAETAIDGGGGSSGVGVLDSLAAQLETSRFKMISLGQIFREHEERHLRLLLQSVQSEAAAAAAASLLLQTAMEKSTLTQQSSALDTNIRRLKGKYVALWNAREENTAKCEQFMERFDATGAVSRKHRRAIVAAVTIIHGMDRSDCVVETRIQLRKAQVHEHGLPIGDVDVGDVDVAHGAHGLPLGDISDLS